MIKKYLPVIVITSLLTLLPIVFGLIFWEKLPEQFPAHFNVAGEADGYSSKSMAVFGLPLGMLLIHVICIVVTLADPKRRNIDGKPFVLMMWITPVISLLVSGLMYSYAFGRRIPITTVVLAASGVLFIVLGNYLPKCGQNYSIGIKVPWALNDEDNWRATHRFGGKVYVAAGIAIVIMAFLFSGSKAFFWAYFAIVIIAGIAPEAYSYVYYLKHEKKK